MDCVVQEDFLKAASRDGFLKGREGRIPARRKPVCERKFMCVRTGAYSLGIPSTRKSTCAGHKSLNSSLSLAVHILVMPSKHWWKFRGINWSQVIENLVKYAKQMAFYSNNVDPLKNFTQHSFFFLKYMLTFNIH